MENTYNNFETRKNELNILLVEDNEAIIFGMRRIFENLCKTLLEPPVHIDTAEDGMEALSLAKEHTYDLIITDNQMPKMGGYELLENLAATEKNASTPTYLHSATTYPTTERKNLRNVHPNLTDILEKPVRSDQYAALLKTIFNKYLKQKLSA